LLLREALAGRGTTTVDLLLLATTAPTAADSRATDTEAAEEGGTAGTHHLVVMTTAVTIDAMTIVVMIAPRGGTMKPATGARRGGGTMTGTTTELRGAMGLIIDKLPYAAPCTCFRMYVRVNAK